MSAKRKAGTGSLRLGRCPLLVVMLLGAWLPARAWGQGAQPPTGATDTGFPVNGAFYGSKFDSVQINNGNLHLELPIATVNGRGQSITYKYVYDSKFSSPLNQNFPEPASFHFTGGDAFGYTASWSVQSSVVCGTTVGGTNETESIYSGFTLTEPDGTRHASPEQVEQDGGNGCVPPTVDTPLPLDDGWILHVGTPGGLP
ncbi:MAG: hypothetical protein ACRDF8_10655, partial [Chloroflexota bacterium]